ncbi:MAG: orotate phosphoribosyltransferase [Planctomycetota bacterium]|jgi:orotate phosphoribosyltransferase
MHAYQEEFIDFMIRSGVLLFGEFTTKSKRQTPYFVNTALYSDGSQISRLGEFYASKARERFGDEFDVLFGPAYKGIPLVCTTAISLHRDSGREVAYAFDRKEAKDHGEGGVLVGHKLKDGDRVLILEDVTTAGTSIRETVPKLRAHADIELVGLIVSIDRCERGQGDRTALSELSEEFDMPCEAIVTIHDVVESLRGRKVDGQQVMDAATEARIAAYLEMYEATS